LRYLCSNQYYQAIYGGAAGKTQPQFSIDGSDLHDFLGSSLVWRDMGVIGVISKASWSTGTAYAKGATITANGYVYAATVLGVSGPSQPAFPVAIDKQGMASSTHDAGSSVSEGTTLVWMDAGTSQPTSLKNLKEWTENTPYFYGDGILDVNSGHYYVAIQAGMSGATQPQFSVPKPVQLTAKDSTEQWQDIGSSLPTSATVGTPPSDQTVNLLNYTYAQAHALSRFNLASGVVFDFIKPPNLSNVGSQSSPNYVSTAGAPLIDAVLAVTVYFKPIDAERQFHKSDLIPGGTVGFSLTSPSSNFYVGGSSEFFIRNLQIMGGAAFLKVSELGPTASGSTTVTSTIQQEKVRGFFGISFNISGFLQSLF